MFVRNAPKASGWAHHATWALVLLVVLLVPASGWAASPQPGPIVFEQWPDDVIAAVDANDTDQLQAWADGTEPAFQLYGAYGLAVVRDDLEALCDLTMADAEVSLPAGDRLSMGVIAIKLLADFPNNDSVSCLATSLDRDEPYARRAMAALDAVGNAAALEVLARVDETSPLAVEAANAARRLEELLRLDMQATVDGELVRVTLENVGPRPLQLVGSLGVLDTRSLGTVVSTASCLEGAAADLQGSHDGLTLDVGGRVEIDCPRTALEPDGGTVRTLVVLRGKSNPQRPNPARWSGELKLIEASP